MKELIVEDKLYDLQDDDFNRVVELMQYSEEWGDTHEEEVQAILGRSKYIPFSPGANDVVEPYDFDDE
jgi:hypothetical protein